MRPANRSYNRRPKLCAMQMEGIVSKSVAAPNRSGRNEAWLKIKCVQRGKFPIRRLREGSAGVAALHLGQHEGDELRYIGKVGTGFTRKSSIEIRLKLDAITTAKSPLRKPLRTLKLRGSSRNMWRTGNTATSLRKATSCIARSRSFAR